MPTSRAAMARSDGLLASRASHVGGTNGKLEEFARDPLGRLTSATTKLGGVAKRALAYAYDAAGNLKSKTSSVGDSQRYVISARICKRSTICNEAWANRVYDHVNRNDVPYSWDDEGTGDKDLLLGSQPIYHEEFPSLRRSVNTTREGHIFHPGEVTHEVLLGDDGYLQYVITGTGSGGNPSFQNAAEVLTFGRGAEGVLRRYGHPPRERGPPYPHGP